MTAMLRSLGILLGNALFLAPNSPILSCPDRRQHTITGATRFARHITRQDPSGYHAVCHACVHTSLQVLLSVCCCGPCMRLTPPCARCSMHAAISYNMHVACTTCMLPACSPCMLCVRAACAWSTYCMCSSCCMCIVHAQRARSMQPVHGGMPQARVHEAWSRRNWYSSGDMRHSTC